MSTTKRILDHGSLGVTKAVTKRACESDPYFTSAVSTVKARMWAESGKNRIEIKPPMPENKKDENRP